MTTRNSVSLNPPHAQANNGANGKLITHLRRSELKQPAGIRSGGLVDLETAIQRAVEVVEMRRA